jgi:hypothetical protein
MITEKSITQLVDLAAMTFDDHLERVALASKEGLHQFDIGGCAESLEILWGRERAVWPGRFSHLRRPDRLEGPIRNRHQRCTHASPPATPEYEGVLMA